MREKGELSIRNLTKSKLPRLPFRRLKNYTLGKNYILSLVFIGDAFSKKLNKEYRGRKKPTDILSFSISPREGEIFINLKEARRRARVFGKKLTQFAAQLFIHGLMHLKGFKHSSKMNHEEKHVRVKFHME